MGALLYLLVILFCTYVSFAFSWTSINKY